MGRFGCGLAAAIIGAVLVVIISIVAFGFLPGFIENMVKDEVILIDDTIQLERFENVPFPLNFTVRIWNISNVEEVVAGGVPILNEVGPYVYKNYQRRLVSSLDEDSVTYRNVYDFEFDTEASYPHTEDDLVTIVNIPYHAILQVAESMFPSLMPALSAGLNGIFGQYNTPIIDVKVRDLLIDGIKLCENPGLIGAIACSQVRALSEDSNNLVEQEDGSLLFSLVSYRIGTPSVEYVASRGLEDSQTLGDISLLDDLPHLLYWTDGAEGRGSGPCNMVNGTDSGIFAPFVDREQSLWALNLDICRSVELRYQYDLEYEGIPAVRFSANEFFLDNHQGCFCLNITQGITAADGCLLDGALELYTCTGSYLVLTYPHFLYADPMYRNGVIGVNPIEEDHRIFIDLEPITGTILQGEKRAQFNIFMRPITGITATQNLRTTLTPIVWFEEGVSLPEEFVDEIKTKLLRPLNIVDIVIPTLLAVSAAVLVLGVAGSVLAKRRSSTPTPPLHTTEEKSSEK